MSRIYVASSWRNELQPFVVDRLRAAGHNVFDFRNPAPNITGFSWAEIDPAWRNWTPQEFRDALKHPLAMAGFTQDYKAMQWADTFVGVMPAGFSTALEMGWGAGEGKRTVLLLADGEPELMMNMVDHLALSIDEVVGLLEEGRAAA